MFTFPSPICIIECIAKFITTFLQPAVVGLIYAFVASGNLLTTLMVVKQKFALLNPHKRGYLRKKYSITFHSDIKGFTSDSQKKNWSAFDKTCPRTFSSFYDYLPRNFVYICRIRAFVCRLIKLLISFIDTIACSRQIPKVCSGEKFI